MTGHDLDLPACGRRYCTVLLRRRPTVLGRRLQRESTDVVLADWLGVSQPSSTVVWPGRTVPCRESSSVTRCQIYVLGDWLGVSQPSSTEWGFGFVLSRETRVTNVWRTCIRWESTSPVVRRHRLRGDRGSVIRPQVPSVRRRRVGRS